jgi:type IV pilus assembly protein PilY1
MTLTTSAFAGGNSVPGSNRLVNIVPATPKYPYPGSANKAGDRTDCAGTDCTYVEEMTNYANWWTYYHTRLQAMKTSVSRAFKSLDSGDYRLGFTTISDKGVTNGNTFLGIDYFRAGFKKTWYDKLLAQAPANSTPLRGALSKVGRYFAKRYAGQVDPVQYACQANYAILSTDGYWNTNEEVNNSYRNTDLYGNLIGDMDAVPVARPMYEGSVASSGSLADIAKYYYDTDLRDGATLGNCTGAASPDFTGGNPNVCDSGLNSNGEKINPYQRMTTFTMGLGADGTLNYQSDYETATTGDFYNLKKGKFSVNWPDPINNTNEGRIDDLWHAAVNGKGSYFSAKDPNQILIGFQNALASIKAKLGAGAAAATSTLNPVAGNSQAFVASYTSFKWKGNLESRDITLSDGTVSASATWCVEDVLKGDCSSGTYDAVTGICTTTPASTADCLSPGTMNGSACETLMKKDCTGKMSAQITPTNSRTIYTTDPVSGIFTLFTAANFGSKTYFSAANISGLNQWGTFTPTQRTAAAGNNLVNYLRGDKTYEVKSTNTSADRLYRLREATMGDALESQPAYFGMPTFDYPYPGYAAFKSGPSRVSSVYVGTNDGMLHAFNASSDAALGGIERWAYIPSMVLPNLWKLASTNYSNNHVNFVNGSPIISDICTANCGSSSATWKSILVAGLNGGGRGYYALDITNPLIPALLWEFTPDKPLPNGSPNLGYSFGRPVVTRLNDANGTWVVLVTSGYDNGTLSGDGVTSYPAATQGDGRGHLFVLNAANGTIISDIVTLPGVGSQASPSGLAQIAVWNDEPAGNKAGFAYGGDLLGNLWRFDVNVPSAAPLQLAALSDQYSYTQPITTTPILAQVTPTGGGAAQKVVFVGTGKYLETIDLNDNGAYTKQSIYAIKDDGTTVINPRLHTTGSNKFVQQTLTTSPGGTLRDGSTNPVNFGTDRGWFIDLPDRSTGTTAGSERVNIDGQLVFGTLIFASLVPSSSACSPGGWGWLNYFDYSNGWPVRDKTDPTNTNVSQKYDATIVGINVIYVNGKPVTGIVTSNDPTPHKPDQNIGFNITKSTYIGTRSIWREMIPVIP